MAESTALHLIKAALLDLGVLAAGEDPTAAEADDALNALNRLIDKLAANHLAIWSETRTETAIVASQASYTVGSGGNVNIARPVFLEDVRYQDTSPTPDQEYPLDKLTDAQWQGIGDKDLTSGVPSAWYYNPTYPTGTLYLWPIPTGTTLQLVTYTKTALTEFAALSTSFSLPPGYREMLVTNLAVRLAPMYGRPVPPELALEARESLAVVKRANRRLRPLEFPPDAMIAGGGGYDINQG